MTEHSKPIGSPHRTPKRRKVNISQKIRLALIAMVDLGRNRADAAQAAGIKEDTLYRALQNPEVLAFRKELLRVLRESEASRSISRVSKLADTAQSEHVQLESNKLLMAIEGISPITKAEQHHNHLGLMPGLVIVMGAAARHVSDALPQAIEQRQKRHINRIGQPVPHPSQIKAGS